MAIARPYNPKLIDDGKGGFRPETVEEREARRKRECEERESIEIEKIMKSGFNRTQAEYLRYLERKIHTASHTWRPPPVY